jgi:Holliday junction DNA helicase RuvA
MISFLKGTLAVKQPTRAEIEVNGVGYEVFIPLSTYDRLPPAGSEVTLLTHMQVREDAQTLYGFIDEGQREMFRLMMQVTRVGPKIALSVLSRMSADDFRDAVVSEDIGSIAGISGVGRKTAERIILELKEKVMRAAPALPQGAGLKAGEKEEKTLDLAVGALESLGFKRAAVYKTCLQILGEKERTVEELIRLALRRMQE